MKLIFVIFLLTVLCTSETVGQETNTVTSADKGLPTIQYIGAVSINPTQDAKILADWYTKFGIDLQFSGGVYFGGFETPAGPFYFAIHPLQTDAPKTSSASISVVFRVSDYDSYVSMLNKRGIIAQSVEADSSGHFAHYKDPDGNEMTIWGD